MADNPQRVARMAVSTAQKARHLLIKPRPRLARFLMVSLGVHLLAGLVNYFLPEKVIEKSLTKPVKVRFLPPEPKTQNVPTFVEAPEPKKREIPETDKLISRLSSKAHSNVRPKNQKVQKNHRTTIPKSVSVGSKMRRLSSEKSKPSKERIPIKKKKKVPKRKMPKLKTAETRITRPESKKIEPLTAREKTPNSLGVLAMLESLDASKYASSDNNLLDIDDDEPVSLDTRETKYADYFSRIKFQIEKIWTYPLEAARRGISGEITLKFKLSKEGNLVGVRMVDSSGTEVLDRAALQAVKGAAPYYPFPPEITKDKITILATFVYSPTYGNNVYSYR